MQHTLGWTSQQQPGYWGEAERGYGPSDHTYLLQREERGHSCFQPTSRRAWHGWHLCLSDPSLTALSLMCPVFMERLAPKQPDTDLDAKILHL